MRNTLQTSIAIRTLLPQDNAAMASIIRSVLSEFGAAKQGTVFYDPTTDDLYTLFGAGKSAYFIAEDNGTLVGGCGVYPTAGLPDGCCELVKLYLLPQVRRIGLGRQLIEHCIQVAGQLGYRSMYLESMPELSKAVSLYEKLGFEYLPAPMGDSKHFGCSLWMLKSLS